MSYTAPVTDMSFVLRHVAGLEDVSSLPGYEDAQADFVSAALEEGSKLSSAVLAPLNWPGDVSGSVLENGVVRTPDGFKEAYRQFVDGGWNSVAFDPDYGGQGLPWIVATALQEMWQAANMSFGLCPLLTQGAVDCFQEHGTDEQKQRYLEKLISGDWTGTMNLTEPQAGSDVGALKTRAVKDGDQYRITGQKIYITYGEHDLAENIIHLVLARLPDAPDGIKGISLFIVPKFMVNDDGTLGGRNDLRCVSLEHKLGIKASPTAVMSYGDDGGAIGYLIGEENRGIEYMFTMMNNARLAVGMQGLAIAERAYQQAVQYAHDRVQGRSADRSKGKEAVAIIHHADVRRMLLSMRSQIEAMRCMSYYTAYQQDLSKKATTDDARAEALLRADLLTPMAKAWCTDLGVEIASTGVQIHGGMGFIEETGAAQHYRDARILPIYEGTNGIQANDLLGRKLKRDEGAAAKSMLADLDAMADALSGHADQALSALAAPLKEAIEATRASTAWLLDTLGKNPEAALAGAVPFLRLFSTTIGGVLLAKAAASAGSDRDAGLVSPHFADGKVISARFFVEQSVKPTIALADVIQSGDDFSIPADLFAA
ncbi:MAG: acyl-CoA dehydrogenase [Pseudomonadota bacterium]